MFNKSEARLEDNGYEFIVHIQVNHPAYNKIQELSELTFIISNYKNNKVTDSKFCFGHYNSDAREDLRKKLEALLNV